MGIIWDDDCPYWSRRSGDQIRMLRATSEGPSTIDFHIFLRNFSAKRVGGSLEIR